MESPIRLGLLCSVIAVTCLAAPFDQAPFDVPRNKVLLTMQPTPDTFEARRRK
jgi:hypothetical protein